MRIQKILFFIGLILTIILLIFSINYSQSIINIWNNTTIFQFFGNFFSSLILGLYITVLLTLIGFFIDKQKITLLISLLISICILLVILIYFYIGCFNSSSHSECLLVFSFIAPICAILFPILGLIIGFFTQKIRGFK